MEGYLKEERGTREHRDNKTTQDTDVADENR